MLTKSEGRRGVYAASSAELPYIGKSRVFESYLSRNSDEQYDDDEDWIKLTISREADVYKFGSPDMNVGREACGMGGVLVGWRARASSRFKGSDTERSWSRPCAPRLY